MDDNDDNYNNDDGGDGGDIDYHHPEDDVDVESEDGEKPVKTGEEEDEEDEEDVEDVIETPKLKVEKTKIIYVTGLNRKTSNFMTKYEYTRLVGSRATQIENNNPVHPDIKSKYPNLSNSLDLAEKEINEKMLKTIHVERPYVTFNGISYIEIWELDELLLPSEQINYALL